MTNIDTPAGAIGGHGTTSDERDSDHLDLVQLPPKLRVHALAKLLDVSSREVVAVLADLGEDVRGAQSSVSRALALRVAEVLLPDPDEDDPADDEPGVELVSTAKVDDGRPRDAAPAAVRAPVFAAPQAVFLPPQVAQPEPAPVVAERAEEVDVDDGAEAETDAEDGDDGSRRRRRRGRRGRGRGRGGHGDEDNDQQENGAADGQAEEPPAAEGRSESQPDAGEQDQSGDDAPDGDEEGGTRRRRRRRRRKGGADDDSAATHEDDPPNTVVHVRESRPEVVAPTAESEVRSVKGSTRLEAKRQRRRDGREAGRRRAPVLSEAEFLARREAVDRTMVVSEGGDRIQIAVLEDGVLVEHFVTSAGSGSLVGNVYLGRVQNVLPSMEAAFVDIGRGRNAVLYAGEVDWDAAGLEGKARRIEQALSTGDSVLVQVTKDPIGHKGARLTTQISLPGRFLVYVPGGGATGISRKLADTERKRLKDILKRVVPEDAGVIIRTASEGIIEEELGRDVRRLQAQWEVIKDRAEQPHAQAPQLLYEEPDLLIKVVRDLFTEDFSALIVQGANAWDTIEAYVHHVAPDLVSRLRRHVGVNDAFAEHRIEEQLTKALDRKVWLPSGGYLIIDRTEAMTVIDVNTGKFTGSGGNLEETVTRNNLESAEEIVRQLRLRDIGGIIVIDFIDMVLESNRDLVLRRLTECLGRDRTRHQVAEVTSLGLVQMTRKRIGTGLLESFSTMCEHCRGRGVLVSTDLVQSHVAAQPSSNHNAPTAQVSSGPSGGSSRHRGRGGRSAAQHADVRPSEEAVASGPEVATSPAEVASAPAEVAASSGPEVGSSSAEVGSGPAEVAASSGPEVASTPAEVVSSSGPEVGSSPAEVGSGPEVASGPAEVGSDAEQSGQAEHEPAPPREAPRPAFEQQPVPVVAAARRRTRRAVSRPAGPPLNAVNEG